jgi:acetyl esterase/lipase
MKAFRIAERRRWFKSLFMKLPRPIDLINKTVSLTGLNVTLDVAYGPAPRDKIDFYRPNGTSNVPVIVFFYGGSWQWGHRRDYQFIAALLARQGFVVAVPDYRLYPEVKFPSFLNDCASAVSFVLNHAADFGGDSASLFLAGHSAGAYNAVMLALDDRFLREMGVKTAQLAGVIGLSGPYDFLPLRDPEIKDIFSPPADSAVTQPITFARENAPPLFLAHGAADTTVLPRNMTALAARLRQHGGAVEAKIYPKIGHVGMILAALPVLNWRAPLLKDILGFIAACRAGDHAASRSEVGAPMVG